MGLVLLGILELHHSWELTTQAAHTPALDRAERCLDMYSVQRLTAVSEQTLEVQAGLFFICGNAASSMMSDFLAGYQILLRPWKSNSSTTKKALKFQDTHPTPGACIHIWWILVVLLPPKPCPDVAVMEPSPAVHTHLGQ